MAAFAKSGMESNTSMDDLLECPVCMLLMYPPIHQCCNGHTICYSCKAKVDNICPICRQDLGNIRCLALEKVAEKLELPCKFHVFGCQDILSYRNRLEHEKTCRFCMYNCPFNLGNCSVTGDIKSLVAHLLEHHGVESVDADEESTFDDIYEISDPSETEQDTWMFTLCNCFGHQFYVQFEAIALGTSSVYMAFLRFMGEENEANNFRYCLEVEGKERKMTWQGIPRSIRDSDTSVRDSLDGLIIQKSTALTFFGDGQNLELKVAVRIWRADVI